MSEILNQLFALQDKVALITGGGRGIGQETALMLSQVGAKVAVLDRDEGAAKDTADKIALAGGKALILVADVAKPEQVKRAFGAALDHFGRLDILVNNAALVRRVPALETSIGHLEQWRFCRWISRRCGVTLVFTVDLSRKRLRLRNLRPVLWVPGTLLPHAVAMRSSVTRRRML
jgi:NAD(P)-dependent dehydrogenase (short-subunit alcohol dehydrogenase family)